MVFVSSMTPDITEGLPIRVGTYGGATGASPVGWDVSFGEQGFLLAPTAEAPYQRQTEATKKQQIDTSDEAGEQSLGSWWSRSQGTWDLGAGIRWYEPGTEDDTKGRFRTSTGIDVWTQGELRLLNRMTPVPVVSGAKGWVCNVAAINTDASGFVEVRGETVRAWYGADAPAYTQTTGLTSGTNDFTQPVAMGRDVWFGSNTGIWKYQPHSNSLTRVLTHGVGSSRVWAVKQRFIVALGNVLYEVPFAATGPILTLGAVICTHPEPFWTWTDVVETSGAILASGFSRSDSAIFRFAMVPDPITGDPTLSSAEQVGKMPPGETIQCMGLYLGTALVLGTRFGVRVGKAEATGDVMWGPLTMTTTKPVMDVTFNDRFAYVTVLSDIPGGSSGAARIDLSAEIGTSGRFAWAYDARVPALGITEVRSVAVFDNRVVLTTAAGTYQQSSTLKEQVGWLEMGRVRFRTAEPKAFRLARLVTLTHGGQVRLTAIDAAEREIGIVSYVDTANTEVDVAITTPGRTLNTYLSFRVYLVPTADGLQSPEVGGVVVKAIPAGGRIRLFQYPLSIYDSELDRHGVPFAAGSAYSRLRRLEELEETSQPVSVTDHRTGEAFTGQIDSIGFSSNSPPDRGESGFGGIAVVVVRRL